ncbi:hypothetical protein PSTT_15124 [Puccinia striiformis]|uniref:K Homology domain-containing protein n=1 Tax=Puccinia striiformis TaxID=27350 RepID=A0A2S4UJ23_9BASI|nr:hypothetical protein PSTT_15124 [Puccinia striiformis]
MDFYSTFFCLPPLHQPQPQHLKSLHHQHHHHQQRENLIINNNSNIPAPSPPSSASSAASSSPHHSASEHSFVVSRSPPVSLPLVSRIPSRITTSTTTNNIGQQVATAAEAEAAAANSAPASTITTNINTNSTIPTPAIHSSAHHHQRTDTIQSAISPPRSSTTHSASSSTTSSNPRPVNSSSSDATRPIPQNAPLPAPEIVQAACAELMSDYHCLVNPTQIINPATYAFHLSGSFPQVMAARGRLLREQPFQVESLVAVDRNDVLENGPNVRPVMKIRLDEIASASRAHLSIVGNPRDGGGIDIVVRGDTEAVEEARVRLLVLLDQLNGLHSEVCEIDYKLHHIIAGRKRSVIQSIQEETATNIHFPSVISGGGILSARSTSLVEKQNMIFITGEFFGVQRAREMLFQVSMHKSKCIISRDTAMLPRKLDWLLMEKLPQLQEIMYDNGTFINFPPIGSQVSVLSVYGDHRVHIERTIRSLMLLACEFYIANVWLLPKSIHDVYPNGSQPSIINQAAIQADGNRISIESGAEVVFKSTNSFEVYGTEQVTKRAVEKILELEMVKNSQVEIRFQVELACEHRDFVSGKKNGKLNKIMKTSNVKIKFESFNDYNFMLNLSGNPTTALMGLTLLEEELPAEISFHIPEGYHKRIIGVGGKNIQRIMKKYGVYVKFSNAKEFAKLGGYQNNHDNVVARTPAKNAENLENLKQSVMELVHPKDKDFLIEYLHIDRTQHRTILGEKSIFIHDIESKTNTCFYFPSTESGSSTIEIFGPRSQIAIAKQMIMSHIGLEADCRLVATSELQKVVASEEFDERVIQTCKNHWNVTVLVINGGGESEELTVKFGLTRANAENLQHARDTLEAFLIEKKIHFHRERGTSGSYHRRNTVTSISSLDRSTTGFSNYTPPTPTDTVGFGTINRHSSEKDLHGLVDRTSGHFHYPSLSSSINSSSSYAYHPAMSMNRLYNQYAGLEGPVVGAPVGPTAIGPPSNTDWTSIPRQMVKNNYTNNNPLANGLNMSSGPIGKPMRVPSALEPNPSTWADLPYGSGSLSKDYNAQGLFNGANPIGGESPTRGTVNNPAGLGHRHRFSQGGLNNYSSGLMNGFAGLNLGL